ncbi:MAG: CARDB domain-containing protein [Candidatus Hodarchaeota archaeon]
MEKKLPDLYISEDDISFQYLNTTLKEGELVNISVMVHNIGQTDATEVTVRFFNDSEIITYENEEHVLIKKIPINKDRLVWVNWVPDHMGLTSITVKLYCKEIESNFANNVASKELEVKPK